MLTTLRIKNLALVDDLTVELQPGLNIITGETGAGKSMIIGALNLILGERADRTLLRSGTENCSVEAAFEISKIKNPIASFLDQNGLEPCEEDQLLVKRMFTSSGTNRQFINGSATSLQTLAALGQFLVDMHGPHEHQSLLHPGRQLAILDAFGKLEGTREAFSALIRRRAELEREKAELIVDEKTYAQQIDLLRFQCGEILAAKLAPDEEQTLENQYKRSSNAARLLELSQTAVQMIDNEEASLMGQAGALGRTLQELQRIDPGAASLVQAQEQVISNLHELQADLSHYLDKLEIDPQRLQQLEERLNTIHSLKRKYGASVAEVIAFGEEAARKLLALEQRDEALARIQGQLKKLEEEILARGKELSALRKKLAPQLSKAVAKHLSALGFKQGHFEAVLDSRTEVKDFATEVTSSGLDQMDFQFAPNPGEPARPLRAIASSGELARVMLALKTVLAVEDEIPVLVFDEVDANVGGETAHAVGEKMRKIAAQRQVLCITHLPQVAAAASAHYVVNKMVKGGRTISEIGLLERDDRVTELARMLGGQSDASRKHARALLQELKDPA
jgi:DNA repair protein RecN (Recombination protein N)